MRRFVADQSANSTTEYALIIALVAAALFLSGEHLQFAVDFSFNQAADSMGSQPPHRLASAPLAGPAAADEADVAPRPSFTTAQVSHFFAWAGLIAATCIIAYTSYRRKRTKRQFEELHCGPTSIADEPSNPNFIKRQEIQRVLLRHFDQWGDAARIEVRQVMSPRVHSVQPAAAVEDLREIMEREGFHHLLVIKQGELLGVISDRDFKNRRGWLARHIMTACPLTVSPSTQVSHAITMMLHQRISCLPVVEGGKVCGIMTVTDMLMTLQCLIKLMERSSQSDDSGLIHPAPATPTGAKPAAAAPVAAC